MSAAEPWPQELRVNPARDVLSLIFDNGDAFQLAAEYLRVESPSAEVQGHSARDRVFIGGKRGVKIANIEPVGRYAVRITFDDGHDTGLYTWSYLRELAKTHESRWETYLRGLAVKGLGRD